MLLAAVIKNYHAVGSLSSLPYILGCVVNIVGTAAHSVGQGIGIFTFANRFNSNLLTVTLNYEVFS